MAEAAFRVNASAFVRRRLEVSVPRLYPRSFGALYSRKLPMVMSGRPRRSVLYMPGSNARAQDKAKILPVDGIILDLEDATAPDAKAAAREQVCKTVREG